MQQPAIPAKSTAVSIDVDRITTAASHFKDTLAIEQRIQSEVVRAMRFAHDAVRTLAATVADEGLLQAESIDGALIISTEGRTLTLAPANGTALDTRLLKPRAMLCSQVLVFAHITGQELSTLLSTFRVYSDGFCTDGEVSWNLNDSGIPMANYMTGLVAENLFECDLFWPEFDQLPDYLQAIPVTEDRASTKDLSKPCIGFECALRNPSKAK